MTNWHWQKRWSWGDWNFMLTYGQGFGIGLLFFGRWNGPCFHLGPLIFDVQPPLPKSWREAIDKDHPL